MKKIFFIAPLLLVLLSFWAITCQAQPSTNLNLEEAKKGIAASNGIYFQAFAKGDSSIFIDRYAKDCWIIPPNSPALCGADAPREFLKRPIISSACGRRPPPDGKCSGIRLIVTGINNIF